MARRLGMKVVHGIHRNSLADQAFDCPQEIALLGATE
jgi:hypothetical protein